MKTSTFALNNSETLYVRENYVLVTKYWGKIKCKLACLSLLGEAFGQIQWRCG